MDGFSLLSLGQWWASSHYPGIHIVPHQIYNIETKYSLGIPEPTLLYVMSLRRQKDWRAWLTLTTGREWGRERMHKGHSWEVRNHRPLFNLSATTQSLSFQIWPLGSTQPVIHLSGQQEDRKAIRIVRANITSWCQNEANLSMGWACYECQERVMPSTANKCFYGHCECSFDFWKIKFLQIQHVKLHLWLQQIMTKWLALDTKRSHTTRS